MGGGRIDCCFFFSFCKLTLFLLLHSISLAHSLHLFLCGSVYSNSTVARIDEQYSWRKKRLYCVGCIYISKQANKVANSNRGG